MEVEMREIKFRAWDKEQKHWVNGLHFSLHLTGNITDPCQNNLLMNDRYDVQQYTGLKDKNGKEIYEGDIIAIGLTHKTVKAIIEWNDRDACFGCKWDEDIAKVRKEVGMPNLPANLVCGGIGNPWEVISNIYENKELLK